MARKVENKAPAVRRARPDDAQRLAELSGQLGYPAGAAGIKRILRKLKTSAHSAVFVAQSPNGGVVGWVQVSMTHILEFGTRAELDGVIVDEAHRSLGAGAKLLEAAEAWARKQGCLSMSVRSNVIRERAHKFYERQGYEHYKTQKAFRKPLESPARRPPITP